MSVQGVQISPYTQATGSNIIVNHLELCQRAKRRLSSQAYQSVEPRRSRPTFRISGRSSIQVLYQAYQIFFSSITN